MSPFLLVAGDFMPGGGMDMPNLALAGHLADLGHPIHLVSHRVSLQIAGSPNVRIHGVPKPANSHFLSAPLLNWVGRRLAAKVARQGGRVVVNGGNCRWNDVNWVHYVHAAYTPTFTGLRAGAWSRLRHCMHLAEERAAVPKARILIANSHRTKRDLIERLRVGPERIHVVHYGIDASKFRPAAIERKMEAKAALGWPADRPVATFVGALGDRRKGFDTLFRAWSTLSTDKTWDVDLIVLGAGSELAAWKMRTREAGLDGRIRFLGFRSDVESILCAGDVLVSPTRYEAYGQGVHEALCCGLPAIVSRTAGVAEQFTPEMEDLLLPDPEDDADLVGRLRMWRANSCRFRALVEPVSERLRNRTWRHMAEDILNRVG